MTTHLDTHAGYWPEYDEPTEPTGKALCGAVDGIVNPDITNNDPCDCDACWTVWEADGEMDAHNFLGNVLPQIIEQTSQI